MMTVSVEISVADLGDTLSLSLSALLEESALGGSRAYWHLD